MYLYYNYLNSKRNNTTKAGPKPCLNINVCSLPLDVYVDSRLEGDRELIVIYRDAFNV